MQRGYLKIVAAAGVLLFACTFQSTFAQTSSFRLKTADSLFQAKRYTQSLEHYEEILKQKQYTPAMLLKMAYIQEGLHHIGPAMFYLNLYYSVTNDKTALEKIDELATKYNLEGYKATDTDKLLSFYHDYYTYLTLALAALMILTLSFMFYTRFRLKSRPAGGFALMIILVAGFGVHFFYGRQIATGIVSSPSTYLMSGPSAAAQVVEIVGDGHRVEILGKKDVWLKILWNGEVAYVKENNLMPVSL